MRNAEAGGSPTIEDVARVAGVSYNTVLRSLSGRTSVRPAARDAVARAVSLLGYAPRGDRSGGVGPMRIALLHTGGGIDYVTEFLVANLDRVAAGALQFLVQSCVSPADAIMAARRLPDHGVDGIILVPPLYGTQGIADVVEQKQIPAVTMIEGVASDRMSFVGVDEVAAAREMTAHLLALGHHRIGFVKGAPGCPASARRYAGYCAALAGRGLPLDETLIGMGLSSYHSGLEAAEQLLAASPPPSAIFASDDDMAAAVIAIAQQHGLDVPSDLTVCGFGDAPLAAVIWPGVTTISRPIAAMVRQATDLIATAIAGHRDGEAPASAHAILPHALVRRQSDASPRRRPRSTVQTVGQMVGQTAGQV